MNNITVYEKEAYAFLDINVIAIVLITAVVIGLLASWIFGEINLKSKRTWKRKNINDIKVNDYEQL